MIKADYRGQWIPSVYSMCMTVNIFKTLFNCFGCAGPSLLRGLSSSCGEQGLLSSRGAKPLIALISLVEEYQLQEGGLQWLQLPGSRAQAQKLWHRALVALQHVGSSRLKDGTRVSCIDCCFLYHGATREARWEHLYVHISIERDI